MNRNQNSIAMKIESVEVSFRDDYSQQRRLYFPGQTVSGTFSFRVTETFTVNSVVMKCKGKTHVEWTDTDSKGDDKEIDVDEMHLEDVQYLIGSEYDKNFRQDLYVGEHRHEFSFKLPENLPTSYENKHAYVRYYLKAKFYRPEWTKTDYEFKEHFTVIGLIDLNGDRRAMQPVNSTDTDTVGCCCCAEGPIVSEFKLERTCYVPGEFINIRALIDNKTSKKMSGSRVELWMKEKLVYKNYSHTDKKMIAELRHGETQAGGQDIWSTERLHIPPCPPTMESSSIMQLTYSLQFIGDIGFLGVNHTVPVTIGTIPLTSVYSMPSNWSSMPSPFSSFYPPLPASGTITDPADISLNPITSQPGTLPSAPPPSFHESVNFTGTIVTEKNEGKKKKQKFQPTFIYYNFGGEPLLPKDMGLS